jgi:hypothetical protein
MVLTSVIVGWGVLVVHPKIVFGYSMTRANVVVHSFEPIPAAMGPIVDEAIRRDSTSPLWNDKLVHNVFLCDRWYPLFALTAWRSGGVTQDFFEDNIFLRKVDIEHNALIGRNGQPAAHDRPLSYYLAHEMVHHLTFAAIGFGRSRRLRAWQKEGYADYVAKERPYDLPAAVEAFRRGDREMDPSASGLYDRYRLLVAYELEEKHLSLDALLAGPIEQAPIEAELLARP